MRDRGHGLRARGAGPVELAAVVVPLPAVRPVSLQTALERLVSIFLPLGITEYNAYAPAVGKEDVMMQALTPLSA